MHSVVRLTVEDHGPGIPPGIRDRVFDPFFTTKGHATFSGLGLSIAHGIVRAHGGEMRLESEPGRFTRVHVELPAAGTGSTERDAAEAGSALNG